MYALHIIYCILFSLSLILINPWGSQSSEIWTEPKFLMVSFITLLNILVALLYWSRNPVAISFKYKLGICLWAIFLSIGLTATLASPFPIHSFWGQSTLGDGLLYWILIASFVLSNALVISLRKELFYYQLVGLLIGGFIVALSIFPQMIDWRIDYTLTSGTTSPFNSQKLESEVWKIHTPIGLFSNRGHTAFVLSAVEILTLLGASWGWVKISFAKMLCTFLAFALICTQTLAGVLSALVATIYIFIRLQCLKREQRIFLWYGISLAICGFFLVFICSNFNEIVALSISFENKITFLFLYERLEKNLSGRLYLWQLALEGIIARPLIGWGFDGFGAAYPFIADWTAPTQSYNLEKTQILELHDFTYSYLAKDNNIYIKTILTSKAHNLLLDVMLSVGLIGFLSYFTLLGFFIFHTLKTPFIGIEAVVITYFIYTLFWFESAQFSHLPWWSLSVGISSLKNFDNFIRGKPYKTSCWKL